MPRVKPLSEVLNGVTRFGRLTVLGEAPRIVAPSGFAAVAAYVRCDCGVEKIVRGRGLVTGYTNSCGCLQRELTAVKIAERSRTHGRTKSPEYHVWTTMKQRCENPKVRSYPHYGGRGITVCDRWRDSFEAFYEDMGPRPTPEHSIERDDVNGNYEPGNCRWATLIEQHNNKRNNVYLTIDGETLTIGQWARRTRQAMTRIHHRVKLGWSDRDSVFGLPNGRKYNTLPPRNRAVEWRGEQMSVADACRKAGAEDKYRTILTRVQRGMTFEQALAKEG